MLASRAMLASTPLLAEVLSPFQALVLGIVQGVTELLPISSSAHLYLVPTLLGWRYEGVAFDVALHGGTLIALIVAFWRDWWTLAHDAIAGAAPARATARGLWLRILVATVPAAIAGKLLGDGLDARLRFIPIQAAMLFLFGLLLWAVDRFRPAGRDEAAPGWTASLAMGFAQALALIPGVSRSGITMTAGRASGLSRVSAARFSFLLATPITFGALLLKAKDVPHDVPFGTMAIGIVTAAVVGLLAIRALLRWLGHAGFAVFFAYRALLALGIVIYFLTA